MAIMNLPLDNSYVTKDLCLFLCSHMQSDWPLVAITMLTFKVNVGLQICKISVLHKIAIASLPLNAASI